MGSGEPWTLRESEVPLPPHEEPLDGHFLLDVAEVAELSRDAELVTDDNQLLAYGWDRFTRARESGRNWYHAMYRTNLQILEVFRSRLARAHIRVPPAR